MSYLDQTLQPYLEYLPYLGLAFLISFLITPIVGYIAYKLQVVDLPAQLRKPNDPSIKTRIKRKITPRAGGVAVIIPFIVIVLFVLGIDKQIVAILLATTILATIGVLDDRYELGSKIQLFGQIFAALLIVAAGISIDSVQSPFDTSIDLRSLVLPFTLANTTYSIALPADIITIIWILIMMNAINWIFGTDGLGEGISIIALITILFISVKFQSPVPALLAVVAAGGILGFLPYNFPPAKIFSGTSATTFYGFLIAVLSILGGVKVSSSVIVLIIPIIDMLWVMVGRINRSQMTNIFRVFSVTSHGDDTHLHHRLLKLGFSHTQVAIVEWIAVGICAVIAFSAGNLPKVTLISVVGVVVLTFFFLLSILLKRGIKLTTKRDKTSSSDDDDQGGSAPESPEKRYAY